MKLLIPESGRSQRNEVDRLKLSETSYTSTLEHSMNKLRVSLACFFLASQYILALVSAAAPDENGSDQTEGRTTIGEPAGSAIVGSVSSGGFRHDFTPRKRTKS